MITNTSNIREHEVSAAASDHSDKIRNGPVRVDAAIIDTEGGKRKFAARCIEVSCAKRSFRCNSE